MTRWWFRDAIPTLLAKWEPLLRVKVNRLFVQPMRTKWGCCAPESG